MKNNEKPEILYHYCSLETFAKIIETKTLRFSDITKSNDSEEIKYLWDKYGEYIKKNNTTEQHCFIQQIIKDEKEKKQHFALCFTDLADSLYFWNSYANGGVAIGFNYKKMNKMIKEKIKWHVDGKKWKEANAFPCKLYPVSYFNQDKACDKNLQYVFTDICKQKNALELIPELTPFVKNTCFAVEREWRIVFTVEIAKIVDNNKNEMSKLWCRYGRKESTITPKLSIRTDKTQLYFDIPFKNDLIEKIILCSNNPMTTREMCYFLKTNNIMIQDKNILKSSCSLQ